MKIFVYGTLKKNHGNHRYYLEDAKFLGHAITVDKYTMYSRGIPFVTKDPFVQIHGEVYEITEDQLRPIDSLEGHPQWYKRELISVQLETGEIIEAWIYLNNLSEENKKVYPIIENGIY